MVTTSHDPAVLAYLLREPLKHIVHLKALSAYSRHIRSYHLSHDAHAGVLFSYPTRVTTYESVRYPETDHVVLISSENSSITERLAEYLPPRGGFVLKLINPADRAVIETKVPLKRVTSFISYTQAAGAAFAQTGQVATAQAVDEKLLPLLAVNGYGRDEVAGYLEAGIAITLAQYVKGELVSACMAVQNHEHVWEICGLFTVEWARRRGYAINVVAAALNRLQADGRIPRYQMDESNVASRNLAIRLGLVQFLATEHFLGAGNVKPVKEE